MLTTEEENMIKDKCLVLQARRNSMSSIKYYIHEMIGKHCKLVNKIFNKEFRKNFFFGFYLDPHWRSLWPRNLLSKNK